MPDPWAVQSLQMPHPRDWQGGQMPRSSRGGGGLGAAGIYWFIRTAWSQVNEEKSDIVRDSLPAQDII